MKKFFLLTALVSSLFTTTVHAEEQIDFENQSWYNSKEVIAAILAGHTYNDQCLFSEKTTASCSKLEQKIADQFNNSSLDENAVEYITLKVHPNYKEYNNIEHSSFNGLRMVVAEFAIKGKTAYINSLLKTEYFAKKAKDEEIISLKEDLNRSELLHSDYANSVCRIENSYFNHGSGEGNAVMYCLSNYHLRYLSALSNTAFTVDSVSESE